MRRTVPRRPPPPWWTRPTPDVDDIRADLAEEIGRLREEHDEAIADIAARLADARNDTDSTRTLAEEAQATAVAARTQAALAEGTAAHALAVAQHAGATAADVDDRRVHLRMGSAALPPLDLGARHTTTITWPTPMPSSTYDVHTMVDPALLGRTTITVGPRTATGVTVMVQATAVTIAGTLTVAAVTWA